MLKCMITDVIKGKGGSFVLLKPTMKNPADIGIEGSITCSTSSIYGGKKPAYGDFVEAFNIHKVDKGWRAKRATIC